MQYCLALAQSGERSDDLGVADIALAQYSQAREYEDQALKLATEANDLSIVGKTHLELASLDFSANHQVSALKHCGQAEEAFQHLNQIGQLASCQD